MARRRTTPTTDGPTGTVQARHNAERQRQNAARELRQLEAEATLAAQKATATRLKNKPTDTRTIAPVDPSA